MNADSSTDWPPRPPESAAALADAWAELQHVVASQLLSAVRGGDAAYPDPAFMQALTDTARSHHCDASLQTAVRLAVEFVGREPR